ncbi:iron ABC transporter permease [Chromatiaceae bacterium AAb-1]|nr:iron ABC transporter permease [Chromatiaceae bacterium AAb-1]
MFKSHFSLALLLSSGLLLGSLLLSINIGSVALGWSQITEVLLFSAQADPLTEVIIWQVRFPRLLCAMLAGAALAVCGALLQNVSRNPLADPYLFGLMSGAGLGATIVSLWLPQAVLGMAAGAFIGALAAVLLVFTVCAGQNWRRIEITLLAGVAVSFMLSALSSFMLYFADPFAANKVIFWLMGSLSRTDWFSVLLIAPGVFVALLLSFIWRRQLDALLLSDETAASLGVNISRLRLGVLVLTAAVTACVVSQCGGIVFVGLMIPHIVRYLFGVTSVRLLSASAIIGALFLLWVDNIARSVLDAQEIPLGVITSVIGSIFFLVIMRQRRG